MPTLPGWPRGKTGLFKAITYGGKLQIQADWQEWDLVCDDSNPLSLLSYQNGVVV